VCDGVSSLRKLSAFLIFVVALAAGIGVAHMSGKANARADIQDYLNQGPEDFEPSGWDQNGTAINDVIDVLGWNATMAMGNVGIGNGSLAALNDTSTSGVDYTNEYLTSGDISTAPLSAGGAGISGDQTNESADNSSSVEAPKNGSVEDASLTGVNESSHPASNETGNPAPNQSGNQSVEPGNATKSPPAGAGNISETDAENLTYVSSHPITFGRPLHDLFTEGPLSTVGTTYVRLVGLRMPSGQLLNVAMKCSGYGY